MSNCDCHGKPIRTEYLGDVQVYTLEPLPDYLLAEADVEDPISGDLIHSLVRIPTTRIVPTGNLDNVTTLDPVNDELEIPENQVRAGFVHNYSNYYSVEYDTSDNQAEFLMIGTLGDLVLIQATGFVTIPSGHSYVISQQYYASADGTGEPTTDSTSGRKLFIPISRTQLLINLGS